jgi:exosortase
MRQSKSTARPPQRWLALQDKIQSLLKLGVKTTHTRIIACGILVGLFYLPVWLGMLWHSIVGGGSSLVLNLGGIYLGLEMLWQQRGQLKQLEVTDEERFLGHAIVLGSAAIFSFCLSSISLQALLVMLILIGIACSIWGFSFFKANWLPALLILIGVYPDLMFLANQLRVILTADTLERFMTWCSSVTLQVMGYPAVAEGAILALPTGKVQVASGCSGADMAFVLGGCSILLGLFMHWRLPKIIFMVVAGILLALVLNIPRIVLLTFAEVYWGRQSFEFWHGTWGGQIFSGIMFTAYYYLAMGIGDRKA